MARQDESLMNLLVRLPWKVGVVLAIVVYGIFRFIVPVLPFENAFLIGFSKMAAMSAPVVALIFLMAAGLSAFMSWQRGRMLDRQEGLSTVKKLDWKQFEQLVGEAFRRKGYFVLENPHHGADGGVDLRLRKDGKKAYVQCKHWKTSQVGVKVVRELYGVMTHKKADEGFVVTYGSFTQQARDFAKGKPISLIDGPGLTEMIRDVQKKPKIQISQIPKKVCPKCGSEMVLRTAKKGKYAGQKFWGCSKFPECKTILKHA